MHMRMAHAHGMRALQRSSSKKKKKSKHSSKKKRRRSDSSASSGSSDSSSSGSSSGSSSDDDDDSDGGRKFKRSIVTGKKIKLKLNQSKKDKVDAVNRRQLLMFLNDAM